jgi:hypothetical protein
MMAQKLPEIVVHGGVAGIQDIVAAARVSEGQIEDLLSKLCDHSLLKVFGGKHFRGEHLVVEVPTAALHLVHDASSRHTGLVLCIGKELTPHQPDVALAQMADDVTH